MQGRFLMSWRMAWSVGRSGLESSRSSSRCGFGSRFQNSLLNCEPSWSKRNYIVWIRWRSGCRADDWFELWPRPVRSWWTSTLAPWSLRDCSRCRPFMITYDFIACLFTLQFKDNLSDNCKSQRTPRRWPKVTTNSPFWGMCVDDTSVRIRVARCNSLFPA